jgi:predicted ABC-type ATPase
VQTIQPSTKTKQQHPGRQELPASLPRETTLSGRSYLTLIRGLKRKGYKVHLFFLCVDNVDVALSRIAQRVTKGGHDVPEQVVRRRFDRSLGNFFREYQPIVDSWHLFDNTGSTPVTIAFKTGVKPRIINPDKYRGSSSAMPAKTRTPKSILGLPLQMRAELALHKAVQGLG